MHRQTDIHLLMIAAASSMPDKERNKQCTQSYTTYILPLMGDIFFRVLYFPVICGTSYEDEHPYKLPCAIFFCDIAPSLRQGALVLYRCVMAGKANPADTLAALPVLLAVAALALAFSQFCPSLAEYIRAP